jgi:hypothetical protein
MSLGAWCLLRVVSMQGKICTKGHRHWLAISSFSGPGYEDGYYCNTCNGQSAEGHCGGSRERWFCEPCLYDLCFQCLPRATAGAQSEDPAFAEVRLDTAAPH